MKRLLTVSAALFLSTGLAQAATFDFDAMGDAYEADYEAFALWDAGQADPYLSDGGISIINMTATPENHLAYFDGGFKNGLGACEITVSGKDSCAGNSDDNLLPAESVTIFFDSMVYLTELLLWGNHADFGNGSVEVNGDSYVVTGGVADLTGLAKSNFFTFEEVSRNGAYLRSATAVVPLPAAGWLLIGGLGGLAAMKRRKKAA